MSFEVMGAKEIDIYHVKIKCIMSKVAIGASHFKVTTEADDIFEEEQMPQIDEVIHPSPSTSKAPFDSNQVSREATADS